MLLFYKAHIHVLPYVRNGEQGANVCLLYVKFVLRTWIQGTLWNKKGYSCSHKGYSIR